MTTRSGRLALDELSALAGEGAIDTVVLAFADMQGRLQGKRIAAPFFLDQVVEHATEACNYLLAVDADMTTVSGYEMSSWERGYGDFVLRPDLATLRRIPWTRAQRAVHRRRRVGGRLTRAALAAPHPAPPVRAPR